MKNISSAIFYMSEWQAIFQQEYSYSEARPFQDKQKNMIGSLGHFPVFILEFIQYTIHKGKQIVLLIGYFPIHNCVERSL